MSPAARFQTHQANFRDRTLSAAELAAVWKLAQEGKSPFDAILSLLILTGQRRSEIAALQWSWIDEKAKLITLPSAITKNRRLHGFPEATLILRLDSERLAQLCKMFFRNLARFGCSGRRQYRCSSVVPATYTNVNLGRPSVRVGPLGP